MMVNGIKVPVFSSSSSSISRRHQYSQYSDQSRYHRVCLIWRRLIVSGCFVGGPRLMISFPLLNRSLGPIGLDFYYCENVGTYFC
jgi:hypothetical protein